MPGTTVTLFQEITASLEDDLATLCDEKLRDKGEDIPTQLERAAIDRVQSVLRQAVAALLVEIEMLK